MTNTQRASKNNSTKLDAGKRKPVSRSRVNLKQPSQSRMLKEALMYIKIGWPVIPVHHIKNGRCSCGRSKCTSPGKHPMTKHGLKDASIDEVVVRRWWKSHPDANIGVLTGSESGFFALDIDPRNGGNASFQKLTNGHKSFPATIEVKTGGGGKHLIFKYPPKLVYIKSKPLRGYPGLDIKADGGYIVAPPSLHVSGKRYQFQNNLNPKDLQPANAPSILQKLLIDKDHRNAAVQSVPGKILEGQRNTILTKLAGTLKVREFSINEIDDILNAVNRSKCNPPLPSQEIEQIVRSIGKYPKLFKLTDTGNAERLIALFGRNIHFCDDWNGWLTWDSTRWVNDNMCSLESMSKEVARLIYGEALLTNDKEMRKAIVQHAKDTESAGSRKAMITLARSEREIPVKPAGFDKDPLLLNVLNGTIDLKTGKLQPHDPDGLITKLALVEFDKNAKCPLWMQFLSQIMRDDEELISFLKTAIGWSLTGVVSDHVLFILYGVGANGKSTFLNTISRMLGDYSRHTPTETLMAKDRYSIPADLARLRGARFVTAIEAEKGNKLAEALIKQMTGGDRITARFLYGNFFEFTPEFKLFLATNHKPNIAGGDHAIWRRIRLIPFSVVIPDERQDKELPHKLAKELPGILNWAVEGCLEWQKQGLQTPKKIMVTTKEYRDELDTIKIFLDECLIKNLGVEVKASDLYNRYKNWCETSGEFVQSQKLLGLRLTERGHLRRKKRDGWYWTGLKLVEDV